MTSCAHCSRLWLISFVTLFLAVVQLYAQNTAFSFQGNLQNAGTPSNGNFDFEFLLFDSLAGGSQIGATQTHTNVTVANGLFSVSLDFGSAFPGANRFLEIRVRPAGGGPFTALNPRQQIASSPYSIKSISADVAANASNLNNQPASFYQNAGNLTAGTIADARIGSNIARRDVSNTFTSQNIFTSNANEFRGDGANITNINAGSISFGTIGDGFLSANIPRLSAANNFSNQNNFGFSGRTLQIRNDGGIVPGFNLTGTGGNLGILRLRNSLEVWPSDDLSRGSRIDLRNNAGSATVVLNGTNGTVDAANLPAFKGVQTFRDPRNLAAGIDVAGGTFADLESMTVNVPANGFLVITATANVGILTVQPVAGVGSAWLKLEETTGAPVQLTEVGKTIFVNASQVGTVETLAISWSIPVVAGTRSFKTILTVPTGNPAPAPLKVWTTTLNAIFVGRGM